MTAAICSEHIVKVTDADSDPDTGLPFFVMELLDGDNLATLLKKVGQIGADQVVHLLHQVGLALDKTHARDVVHRDLKPENLFLTMRDDGTSCLKILDFGIAKMIDLRTHARSTRNFGTPLYMSPEQYPETKNVYDRGSSRGSVMGACAALGGGIVGGDVRMEPWCERRKSVVERAPNRALPRGGRSWGAVPDLDGFLAQSGRRFRGCLPRYAPPRAPHLRRKRRRTAAGHRFAADDARRRDGVDIANGVAAAQARTSNGISSSFDRKWHCGQAV